MRLREDRAGIPPKELRESDSWLTAHGIEPRAAELARGNIDEAQYIIAANQRWWGYPKWIVAPVNWAIEHGGWPVLSWFAGKPDEADRPRSDFVAQLPRQPINDGILPHQGRWFADGGVIRCWEHNLTRDAH